MNYVDELCGCLSMLETWMLENNKKVLTAKRIMKNVKESFTTSLSGYTRYSDEGFSVPYVKINLKKNSYKVRLYVKWDKPGMNRKERKQVYEEVRKELDNGFNKIKFDKFQGQVIIKGQLHMSVIA